MDSQHLLFDFLVLAWYNLSSIYSKGSVFIEPIFSIDSDIPEEAFTKAVCKTASNKGIIPAVIMSAICLYFVVTDFIYNAINIFTLVFVGLIFFNFYTYFSGNKKASKKYVYERILTTGDSTIRTIMRFYENEIVMHEKINNKDFHIPYQFIEKVYTFDEMLVLVTNQNQAVHIMRTDIPDITALINFITLKCPTAKRLIKGSLY